MRFPLLLLAAAAALSACAALKPPADDARKTYALEARLPERPPAVRRDVVVMVAVPRARPGFDTADMAYVRRPHEIEYFARNRWLDTPARMLGPLVVEALEQSGSVRGAVYPAGGAAADLRLDLEIVRLVQDFSTRPSRVRFTLHARLTEIATRRLIAAVELDETESAPGDDPYGGVTAANRALERLLGRLVDFCASGPAAGATPAPLR
jgi:cholesterol transport system auxiliary component